MRELERKLKALANKRRLAILKYLHGVEQASVGDIASQIRLSFRATSKHLGILFATNILDKEQISLTVYYRLARPVDPLVSKVLDLV